MNMNADILLESQEEEYAGDNEEFFSEQERADFDGLWKEAIERFFPELLKRTLPDLYEDADFSIKPEFLSKELQDSILRPVYDEHNPPLFVDELVKVRLKNGQDEWVLLHIEIQGSGGDDISFRMMLYCSLIFAHHRKVPVALAILTKPRPKNEIIGRFHHSQYGTSFDYKYSCFEVYNQDEEELAKSDNPFDLIFLAAKKTLKIKGKNKELQKYHYMREAIKLLAAKGFNDNDCRDLFNFIDRLVNLRDLKLRKQLKHDIEGEKTMRTLSPIEKLFLEDGLSQGLAKGLSQGLSQGKRNEKLETAKRLHNKGYDYDFISEVTELSLDDIRAINFA